jgi:hypothetical protein
MAAFVPVGEPGRCAFERALAATCIASVCLEPTAAEQASDCDRAAAACKLHVSAVCVAEGK